MKPISRFPSLVNRQDPPLIKKQEDRGMMVKVGLKKTPSRDRERRGRTSRISGVIRIQERQLGLLSLSGPTGRLLGIVIGQQSATDAAGAVDQDDPTPLAEIRGTSDCLGSRPRLAHLDPRGRMPRRTERKGSRIQGGQRNQKHSKQDPDPEAIKGPDTRDQGQNIHPIRDSRRKPEGTETPAVRDAMKNHPEGRCGKAEKRHCSHPE